MARIEGVDLPRNKRVEVGLTYIYGIGDSHAHQILTATGVNPDTRIKDLTDADVGLLRDYIGQQYKVEGDLRRSLQMNIKRLIEIGSYRGLRHRLGDRAPRPLAVDRPPHRPRADRRRRRAARGGHPQARRPQGCVSAKLCKGEGCHHGIGIYFRWRWKGFRIYRIFLIL